MIYHLEFTLHEVSVWETIDKKDLPVVSGYGKEEYNLLLELILHEVLVSGTVDKTHLFMMSVNDVEFLTNVLPWTPVETC